MTQDAFRSVWSSATSLNAARNVISSGGDSYIPTDRAVVDAPISFNKDYRTLVQVEGNVPGTNATDIKYISLTTDSPIANGTAITDAVAQVLLNPENYGIEPIGAQVLQVERSAHVAVGGNAIFG